ncbi:MAG: NrfD/PsrC family molybdoenzyme membrane anchor subunit [Bacillota bacterium]
MHQVNWPSLIAIYLFAAGVGVAAFYTGVLADLFSSGKYRRLAKYGSYIGVPLIITGTLMLLLDLGRPFRFWLPLLNFRPSSTMSLGVWLLTAFTLLGGLNALTWLAEEERYQNSSLLAAFRGKAGLRRLTGLLGLPVAVLTAGYTGVLLASTSSALWSSTPYMGLLFLVSATSTGMAALMLVLAWRKEDFSLIQKLAKADALVIVLEIAVFILLLLTLRSAAPEAAAVILSGSYALLFWFGIIGCGLVIPLIVELYNMFSPKLHSKNDTAVPVVASALILIGGFLLRYVLLYAGQAPL